jgi:hypothetical protein
MCGHASAWAGARAYLTAKEQHGVQRAAIAGFWPGILDSRVLHIIHTQPPLRKVHARLLCSGMYDSSTRLLDDEGAMLSDAAERMKEQGAS